MESFLEERQESKMISHIPVSGAKDEGIPHSTNEQVAWVERLKRRLRCKAEACRVAVISANPATKDPYRRRRCEDEAQSVGADLWMLRPLVVNACIGEDLKLLAECTEVTAEAVASLQEVLRLPILALTTRRKAMEQLSEAQSMMRIATAAVRRQVPQQHPRYDTDQRDAHNWLVTLSKRHKMLIHRYAMLNDPADPAEAGQLLEEIQEIKGVVARHRAGR